MLTDEQIKQEAYDFAVRIHTREFTVSRLNAESWFEAGAKWHRDNDPAVEKLKELRDIWQERVDYISNEITNLETAQLRVYAATIRESMKGCIKELNKIIES